MSRRARLFSEFLGESDSRSVVSSATHVGEDVSAKRRKISGLNSRVQRMVETMNVTHVGRKRTSSTSSASGSSVPKTPIDDYDDTARQGSGRLGTGFSVIKMGTSSRKKKSRKLAGVFPWDQDSSSDTNEPPPPPVPLPAWLANTFSTLTTKHPLRLLLPRRTESEPTPSPSRPAREDDNPFSFHVSPPQSSHMSVSSEAEHNDELAARSSHSSTCMRSPEPALVYSSPSLPHSSFGPVPPFSTPGPGSVVSHSDPIPSVQFQEPLHVEYCMPIVHSQQPQAIDRAFSLTSPPHSTPIAQQNTAPFYHYHNKPLHHSCPSPSHSVHSDPYTTPACQPVYFDSPTEDPSDSDPLEPGYELESLDFRWEPFIQKAAHKAPDPKPEPSSVAPVMSNSDDYYYETRVEPEGEDDEDGQLYASVNMQPMTLERCISPGPFAFTPPRDASDPEPSQQTPITPDRPVAPFFAPAPGIFVSPLRKHEGNTSPRVAGSAQATVDPQSSQASNDSIEDWDDAADD